MTDGTPPTARPARPLGVTIIAVLAAISGVYALAAALVLFTAGGIIGVGIILALLILAIAAISLVFAWGAWTLQPWAWTLGIVLEVLAVLQALAQLASGQGGAIVSLAVAGVILWYLFTPEVKSAFGRT